MTAPAMRCPEGAATPEGASKSGDYRLSWSGPEGAVFRLVERQGERAEVIYEGSDSASTVTGRVEGDYHYRVGVVGPSGDVARWSDDCTVIVRPYSLGVALLFFAFGFVVTIATCVLILRGHRMHKRGAIG